jgi:hypothetical protein
MDDVEKEWAALKAARAEVDIAWAGVVEAQRVHYMAKRKCAEIRGALEKEIAKNSGLAEYVAVEAPK